MTELKQIFKCNVCGNITEVLHTGQGELVCCGQPMELLEEKKKDEGLEKHVPVVEEDNNNIKVRVGSKEHPMEEGHYIEWIEIIFKNGKSIKKMLNFKNEPGTEFCKDGEVEEVRIYCNIHGLWKTE
jgi:superoxide reductase